VSYDNDDEVQQLLRENAELKLKIAAVEQIIRDIDAECPPPEFQTQWWEAMDTVRTELKEALA
jgi:hypothetical protein